VTPAPAPRYDDHLLVLDHPGIAVRLLWDERGS
jgi:hypothetical protein